VHGLRQRPSNRRLSEETRERAVRILSQELYRGFGPTQASEYLAQKHKVSIGREALRKLMIHAGLWRGRKPRIEEIHQWRPRRSSRGELGCRIGQPGAVVTSRITWRIGAAGQDGLWLGLPRLPRPASQTGRATSVLLTQAVRRAALPIVTMTAIRSMDDGLVLCGPVFVDPVWHGTTTSSGNHSSQRDRQDGQR
jgi:hypothetical protein